MFGTIFDVWDGDGALGDVGGKDELAHAFAGEIKHVLLLLLGDGRVEGQDPQPTSRRGPVIAGNIMMLHFHKTYWHFS